MKIVKCAFKELLFAISLSKIEKYVSITEEPLDCEFYKLLDKKNSIYELLNECLLFIMIYISFYGKAENSREGVLIEMF